MLFTPPLTPGILIRRYKRFLADVDVGGRIEVVHCPNPGSMLGLDTPGAKVFVSRSKNPKRKLPLTLEIVDAAGALVGVNTGRANTIAEEAISAGLIETLSGYGTLRREVRYGENSRIDFLLQDDGRKDCYVEIKNVTLSRQAGLMEFPDCQTKRGAKHLAELANQVSQGNRAVMLFVIQRADGDRFTTARDLDPAYAAAFDHARSAGVEMLAWMCRLSESKIELERPLPFDV